MMYIYMNIYMMMSAEKESNFRDRPIKLLYFDEILKTL